VLARKGFRLVVDGPQGLSWRRERPQALLIAVVVMAAFGGLMLIGDPSVWPLSLVLWGVGAGLLYWRRPGTVEVSFSPLTDGGTELALTGGPQADEARPLVERIARA